MTGPDHAEVYQKFREAVNMPPATLLRWLDTEDSRLVGWHAGERVDEALDGESVGHEMGRHIVGLLHKKKGELTDEDYARMGKVVGYIHRHLAQGGPAEDVEHSRWRYSLMNWGHDPLKD